MRTIDNIPKVFFFFFNYPFLFEVQDGCADIRGKLHPARADSLHMLHLPPIKRPRSLSTPKTLLVQTTSRLQNPRSLSHSLSPPHSPSPQLTRLTSPSFTDQVDSSCKHQVSITWPHIYLEWSRFSRTKQHGLGSWICSELTGFALTSLFLLLSVLRRSVDPIA